MVAAHQARVAPFNVNYRYVDDELAHLFGDARPAAVIYHARFADAIGRVVERLDARPLLLQVADESGAALLPDALDYEDALAKASNDPLPVRPSAHDLHILYTGGTTGMPKGVLWRIGDLMLGPLGLRRRDGAPVTDLDEAVGRAVRSDVRGLVGPPLMHGAGTWSALGAWCGGGCVVFPDRVDGLDAADLMATGERERVTRMPLVGDAFARPIVEALEARPHDLGTLRTFVNSAAAISPGVKARMLELLPHSRIVDVLGSSESGFQVTRNGSSAKTFAAAPGTAVLSGDRSRRLAPGDGEMGWLAKGGDAIPLGYLGDPVKTASTFLTLDGERLVVAGDRARLLADGTVEVHGREATTINTGGEKVFAEEVESVLRGLPGVADALVVGRPSERCGTEIVAVLSGRMAHPTRSCVTAAPPTWPATRSRRRSSGRIRASACPTARPTTPPPVRSSTKEPRSVCRRGSCTGGAAAGDPGEMPDLHSLLADLAAEGDSIDALVAPPAARWADPTPAEGWTIAHQIAHLAWTDDQAVVAATDAGVRETRRAGLSPTPAATSKRARGKARRRTPRISSPAGATGAAAWWTPWPPSRPAPGPWFGPPMGAATLATARLMETWAHGEDVADALGVRREPTHRLRHVAHIGVRTRDFAFRNRGLEPPTEEFRVVLQGPGGEEWTWGPADARQSVTGPALDFCHVVAQRRHRDDLALVATGPDADRWLDVAQAFADRPAPAAPRVGLRDRPLGGAFGFDQERSWKCSGYDSSDCL